MKETQKDLSTPSTISFSTVDEHDDDADDNDDEAAERWQPVPVQLHSEEAETEYCVSNEQIHLQLRRRRRLPTLRIDDDGEGLEEAEDDVLLLVDIRPICRCRESDLQYDCNTMLTNRRYSSDLSCSTANRDQNIWAREENKSTAREKNSTKRIIEDI